MVQLLKYDIFGGVIVDLYEDGRREVRYTLECPRPERPALAIFSRLRAPAKTHRRRLGDGVLGCQLESLREHPQRVDCRGLPTFANFRDRCPLGSHTVVKTAWGRRLEHRQ